MGTMKLAAGVDERVKTPSVTFLPIVKVGGTAKKRHKGR